MNPLPGSVLSPQRHEAPRFQLPSGRAPHAALDLPLPLVLHQRAQESLRVHVFRAVVRGSVLLVADVLVLLGLRGALHLVREDGGLGLQVSAMVDLLFPRGATHLSELLVATLVGLFVLGTYKPGDSRRDASRIFAGTALGMVLVFWDLLWGSQWAFPLFGYVAACAITGAALTAERLVIDLVVEWARPQSSHVARVLAVGPAAEARSRLAAPPFSDSSQFVPVGFLAVEPHTEAGALGGASDLPRVIQSHHIDTVILCGNIDRQLFDSLLRIAHAAGCHVFAAPPALMLPDFAPTLVRERGIPLLQLTRPALRGQQLVLKRGFDLGVSLVGLIVIAPLGLLIALVIRLSSPGPIIFRQERVGLGGRRFWIYKFRSMVHDAESRRPDIRSQSMYDDERLFKIRRDPRITRVGAFLRRTSLDELPQLINVLRGDMSLVGPRPPLPSEVTLYEERHYARFNMKPGMTGPWQVSGRSNITEFERVVLLETNYISQWSIWKDFSILLRTIPVVVRMDGAH